MSSMIRDINLRFGHYCFTVGRCAAKQFDRPILMLRGSLMGQIDFMRSGDE